MKEHLLMVVLTREFGCGYCTRVSTTKTLKMAYWQSCELLPTRVSHVKAHSGDMSTFVAVVFHPYLINCLIHHARYEGIDYGKFPARL